MKSSASKSSLQTTLRRLVGAMLALVLVVTGCNLPSKSAESTQPENPTPAAPLPSPTPSEPPPAVTMTGALVQRCGERFMDGRGGFDQRSTIHGW